MICGLDLGVSAAICARDYLGFRDVFPGFGRLVEYIFRVCRLLRPRVPTFEGHEL